MYAFEIPGTRFSLPAGEDIERYRFITVGANSECALATSSDRAYIVGVSMNEAKAGQVLEIADGIVMVEAGNAINAGGPVWVGEGGKAVSGPEAGNLCIALTSAAAAGELITVKI